MSFEIGDIVEPQTVITFSGEDFDLVGTSGTVIDRQIVSTTVDNIDSYQYKVELFEPLVVGSGVTEQTEDVFWFSEEELTGEFPEDIVDFQGVSELLGSGVSTVSNNKVIMEDTLSKVESTSPYHTDLTNLISIVEADENVINSQDISSQSKGDLNVASGVAELTAFNSEIYKELSDNLYGFYTLVSELEQELQTESVLSAEQEQKALEDDEQNFNIFYETYVNTEDSSSLLTPGASSTNNETEISGLIDDSELTSDLLIAPLLNLETD